MIDAVRMTEEGQKCINDQTCKHAERRNKQELATQVQQLKIFSFINLSLGKTKCNEYWLNKYYVFVALLSIVLQSKRLSKF